MTEELPDLTAMAQCWIERLRLTDWSIRWEWARHYELDPHKAGRLTWNLERRTARVQVLVPTDSVQNGEHGLHVPAEEIVVHELLHLVFAMLDDHLNDTANILFERALNDTADALVTLAGNAAELKASRSKWVGETLERGLEHVAREREPGKPEEPKREAWPPNPPSRAVGRRIRVTAPWADGQEGVVSAAFDDGTAGVYLAGCGVGRGMVIRWDELEPIEESDDQPRANS